MIDDDGANDDDDVSEEGGRELDAEESVSREIAAGSDSGEEDDNGLLSIFSCPMQVMQCEFSDASYPVRLRHGKTVGRALLRTC